LSELSVFVNGEGKVSFKMTGFDEHGKTNTIMWDWCLPVGVGNYGDGPEAVESSDDGDDDPCRDRVDPCDLP
jgi:hypothetical protein